MPRPPRGLDENTGRREKGELWRQTKAAATAPRASYTSVDRGTFVAGTTVDGQPQMYFGELPNGDTGLIIRREDGSLALTMSAPFPGSPQIVAIHDRTGNAIAGEAFLSAGASTPRLSYPVRPVDSTDEKSTASTAFIALFRSDFDQHNPAVVFQFAARCSDATTAAEVRITNLDGNPLGAFLAAQVPVVVPAGTTVNAQFETQMLYVPGGRVNLQIEARVTAGTGSVTVRPIGMFGAAQ